MSVYILSDGNKSYLKHDIVSGRYVPVHNQSLAETFTQRNKAQHVLEHTVSKKMRKRYKVIELDANPDDILPVKRNKISREDLIKSIIEEPINELELNSLCSNINSVIEFLQYVSKRKEELITEMSNVDKELEDIKHYIEFNNFNVYSGWLALSMQKQRLNKRRRIQTELRILLNIDETALNETMLKTAQTAIEKSSHKEYSPRILPELFDPKDKKVPIDG